MEQEAGKSVSVAANLLRILLGWFMFVDGLQILLIPNWSAKDFLLSAKTFPVFYAWFAQAGNSWWVDPLNSWGITLIGVALLLGVGIRPAAWAGAALMILYYFPHNAFPFVPHGFVVEEHIIYGAVFALIALWPEAQVWGLARYIQKMPLAQHPFVRRFL